MMFLNEGVNKGNFALSSGGFTITASFIGIAHEDFYTIIHSLTL